MAEAIPCKASSIEVLHISHSFGDHRVLRDVSFSVGPGEFVGILGPNGSGKTTLLNCVCGIIKPLKGKSFVCNEEVHRTDCRKMARLVATVPQESPDIFNFTVEETVLMGRYAHIEWFRLEEEHDFEVADGAMKATGIWRLRHRPVTDLSGGERRRVVIARALAQEPRVLLLDEPTSHLDIRHQLDVLGLIRKLNRRLGLTVLSVFHDLNLSARFCDRLLLMDRGRILAEGTPAQVLTGENIVSAFRVEATIGENAGGQIVVDVGAVSQNRRSHKARRTAIVGGSK